MSVESVEQKLGPNQRKWVDSLRSGNFKQSSNKLQSRNGYCCLGVACEIAKNNGVSVSTVVYDDLKFIGGVDLGEQYGVKEWLALDTENGEVLPRYIKDVKCFLLDRYSLSTSCYCLTNVNDILELTFEQIAEVIETFPHAFFTESK